ncbi:MAG TPA: extracellular solute-binding protein, partial [Ktedonobacteraceae bacterium]
MSTKPNSGSSFNRRGFLRRSIVVGAGALSLEAFLAACGSTAAGNSSAVTATVSTLPANSNPAAVYLFNQVIQQFEHTYPGEKIVGKNDPYDPTTYLAKLAANQTETATESYFTEPPLLIKKHAVADITSLAKSWPYFSNYVPSIASIVTDPATGKIYGIPQNGYAMALFYSRKLFKAAGLDPDKPPTTWNEFQGYAKQLTGAGVYGYAETSTQNQGGWHFTNWIYTTGGDVQSSDGTKAIFNSAQGVSVLQMLKKMRFTDKSITQQQLFTQDNLF